ncbi:hypothetical protein [uncultured Ruminococcus sp.]|uniref:hypothetical protein n=1 Tax=uncultured Ruminococcus sp. TaxID=165186 RepID=UPI00261FC5BB|nr:hypothetical protein [uncultured Ruminococcus sp.]
MANEENLIPFDKRTENEQREIARKGGIASGASRRAYRSLKQAAKAFFKENESAAMNVIQALYEEAVAGNVKAAEKLQDLIGETVQREELALKKKTIAKQSVPNNGKAEALIAGLQEAEESDDLHEEAAFPDADMAEEETETNQPS